jgi:hypothetical protein
MTSTADTGARTPIGPPKWQASGPLDLETMAKARLETINLIQWLARIANSYVAAEEPGERVMLDFRPGAAAFVTKPFDRGLSLELRLPSLEMQFLEEGRAAPHIFDPEEHSPAEVEAWLLVELLHRGVDRTKFSKKLPYDISGLMTGDADDHSPQSCQPALTQLMTWYCNAAAAIDATAITSGFEGSKVVCRPQTLALSCISNNGSKRGGFGFSPGDAEIREPYFYRYSAAGNGSAAAKTRTTMTASKLLAEHDPAATAIAFMKSATG